MRRRAALAIVAVAFGVAGAAVAGVVGFPSETPARASSRPMEVPDDLESFVFNACIPTADLATMQAAGALAFSISAGGPFQVSIFADPGSWSVKVGRGGAHITTQSGATEADGASASRAVAIAQQMYDCLAPYRFVDSSTHSSSSSQRLQLYEYNVAVRWPCLRDLGLDPGPPPTRADFVTTYSARNVSPYRVMTREQGDLRLLLASTQLCPPQPSYLR